MCQNERLICLRPNFKDSFLQALKKEASLYKILQRPSPTISSGLINMGREQLLKDVTPSLKGNY